MAMRFDWNYLGYAGLFLLMGFVCFGISTIMMISEFTTYGGPYNLGYPLYGCLLLLGVFVFYMTAWLPFQIYREQGGREHDGS